MGVNEVELEREKWDVNVEKINTMANEAIDEYTKMKLATQKELESIDI